MRTTVILVCTLMIGCTVASSVSSDDKPVKVEPGTPSPKSLWTRKKGQDWPCFLGPTQDSVSTEKGILTKWPAAGPKLLWEKEIGIGYSMPSISGGRLFLFDRIRNRCRLRCMKAETAETLWTYEYTTDYRDQYGYNGGPRCAPVVDKDRVYIFGPEGVLACVRVEDGKLVWKLDTKAKFGVIQNFFGVGSTPVIEGDLLITHIGGSPPGSDDTGFMDLKGNGTGVVAFNKYTGKVEYQLSNELAGYASPRIETVGKKRLGFLFARGGLLVFDAKSGKQEFHYPWRTDILESVNASNPVIVGRRVLISECYGTGSAVLDIVPGGYKEVWTDKERPARRKSLMTHWMTPIHVDGYVYGSSGRHTNEAVLRCIDLATGKVMWEEPGLTRSSLLLVDGHFVCLSEDGTLRLLRVNPKKYEEVGSVVLKDEKTKEQLLEYPCWAAPILSHGLLYVRGKDRLVCLELIQDK